MSSVVPFSFNAAELYIVTINEKPWTRAKVVSKAPRYNKKLQILSKITVVKKTLPRNIKWVVFTCGLAK